MKKRIVLEVCDYNNSYEDIQHYTFNAESKEQVVKEIETLKKSAVEEYEHFLYPNKDIRNSLNEMIDISEPKNRKKYNELIEQLSQEREKYLKSIDKEYNQVGRYKYKGISLKSTDEITIYDIDEWFEEKRI